MRGKIYRGRSSHQNVKIQDLLQLFRNLFYQKEMKARSEALKTLEIKIKYCLWTRERFPDYLYNLSQNHTFKTTVDAPNSLGRTSSGM